MASLEEARNQLAALQEQKRKAEEEIQAASEALRLSRQQTSKNGTNSSYSNQTFWNTRYATEKVEMYEWYVDFEDMRNYLEKDLRLAESSSVSSRVLVPGCGNSELCEQLVKSGSCHVTGIDYSHEVVKSLQARLDKEFPHLRERITYLNEDCTNLKTIDSGTFQAIVDKGTLDAICSVDYNSSQEDKKSESPAVGSKLKLQPESQKDSRDNNNGDRLKYLNEMWRVLSVGGKLIMITTMTPPIFQDLAFSVLQQQKYSDWTTCPKISLRTKEGGEVFYFAITKIANCRILPSQDQTSVAELSNKDEVLAAFLKQAEIFLRNPEQFSEEHELAQGNTPQIRDPNALPIPPTIESPDATVDLELVRSDEFDDFVCGDRLWIRYVLRPVASKHFPDVGQIPFGGWVDGDIVCLQCLGSSNKNSRSESLNESIEYVEEPSSAVCDNYGAGTSISARGELTLQLPAFGGAFNIVYLRPIESDFVNTVSRKFEFKTLASLGPICVRWPVFPTHPDKLLIGRSIRRRKVGSLSGYSMTSDISFRAVLEDLQAIQALSVTVSAIPPPGVSLSIARCMSWLTTDAIDSLTASPAPKLITEADLVLAFSGEVITTCIVLDLPEEFCFTVLDKWMSYGSLDKNNGQSIVIRMVYEKSSMKRKSAALEREKTDHASICCRFCGANIVDYPSGAILKPLPTGIFDNIMHDLICCEEIPVQAMSSSELVPSKNEISFGSSFLCVSVANIVENSVVITCKSSATLLDSFSGQGAQITLCSGSDVSKPMEGICIDSTLISCARCHTYLGDGQVAGEVCGNQNCSAPSHPLASMKGKSQDTQTDEENERFVLKDLECLRLSCHLVETRGDLKRFNKSVAEIVGNIFLHYSEVYGVSSFVLIFSDYFLSEKEYFARPSSRHSSDLYNSVLYVKLIGKPHHRISTVVTPMTRSNASGHVHLVAHPSMSRQTILRVGFSEVSNVRELRIPQAVGVARLRLQCDDFREILAVLMKNESELSENPVFSGLRMSYLML